MKPVRINKKYGLWEYRKEIDTEDPTNYMYYFYGKDANGKEWAWSTPYYHEMFEFIKASDKDKQTFIDLY